MKTLYESLLTGNVAKPRAKEQPSSKKELEQIIDERIKEIKPRPGQEVDLNWIDISNVDDLSELFMDTNYIPVIDTWKIDHVKDFNSMFAHNKYIVRSPLPVLQKKLLKWGCYFQMFRGCSSLKVAPELPAKTLARHCYNSMFWGCSSLEEPPELPAKTLAPYCYTHMLLGCTALKVAPKLPAKTLELYCYCNMFTDCKSLKDAPELLATELTEGCYAYMFKNCDNLKTKAKIPLGVNLDMSTAQSMYAGCPCENK